MEHIKVEYFLQPQYYNNFSCVGGSCPNSCCIGWQVEWDAESVERLRKADYSEKLGGIIGSVFGETENEYIIKLRKGQRCPFLTEDNFCLIQRELGEEYLSEVCMIYPRALILYNNIAVRTCGSSCCAALDLVMESKDSMKLYKYRPKHIDFKLKSRHTVTKEQIAQRKDSGYGVDIFEFFYDIISDTDYDVETAIIIGALAAQKLTAVMEKKNYELIPEMIKQLKKQLKAPELVNKVKNIKSVPEIRLGVQARLYDEITKSDIVTNLIKQGDFTEQYYQLGYKKFTEHFADRDYVLRNILLNFMFELGTPYANHGHTLFENYSYFVAVAASVKFVAAVSFKSSDDNDHESKFKLGVARISRSLAHNAEIAQRILDILNEYNCKTPAYLAVIVK